MPHLLVATTNPSKFEESSLVLKTDGLEIFGLKDFPNIRQIEETGETFKQNAILKAKGYYGQTGIPCIADDGGLMVDFLGGAPGVNSNRFLGRKVSDQELAEAIINKLAGVPREKRTARLGGFIAFYDGRNLLLNENWIAGYIAERLMSEVKPGFPYRAILVIPQFGKSYGELTHDEHEQMNFRRKNLRELKPKILELLSG